MLLQAATRWRMFTVSTSSFQSFLYSDSIFPQIRCANKEDSQSNMIQFQRSVVTTVSKYILGVKKQLVY